VKGRNDQRMQLLEIAATLFTLICVILSVKRSLWQFPFGVIGTALFFFVVWGQQLYANAALQIFFLGVQFYGWWYWMRGDEGARPSIRSTNWKFVLALSLIALTLAGLGAWALEASTDASMPLPDAAVFGLSVVAQILLGRKRIETWPMWVVINVLSVWLYASQGLWLFTALYAFFFFNAFWGWWEWRAEMKGYSATSPTARGNPA
jgi:nicotinamide mononucleotide transporter